MKRWQKAALVCAGIVLAYHILTQVFSLTRAEENGATWMMFMLDSPSAITRFQAPSRIAVVTPPAPRGLGYIQDLAAGTLRDRLSEAALVCDVRRGQRSWSTTRPQVALFPDKQTATSAGYDYLILVEPKSWRYSANPAARVWHAEILFRGGSPRSLAIRATPEPAVFGQCGFDYKYTGDGKMTGLFSTSHLAKKVAESAAEEMCESLQNEVRNQAESVSQGKDPKPKWHEPRSK